jgi:hypothetical protein
MQESENSPLRKQKRSISASISELHFPWRWWLTNVNRAGFPAWLDEKSLEKSLERFPSDLNLFVCRGIERSRYRGVNGVA